MTPENSNTIQSEGRTVDEAVSEALLRLGARRDEVEIEVIEEGKSGLFGVLGRKRACVEVRRKSSKRRRRRGGRGRRRSGSGEGQPEGAEARRDETPREGGRDGGRERGRERGAESAPRSEARGRPRDGDDGEGRREGSRRRGRRGGRAREEQAAGRDEGRRERRPRDERPGGEGPREDRPSRERPREDRPREDRPRETEVSAETREIREPRERPERERSERERPDRTRPDRSRRRREEKPAAAETPDVQEMPVNESRERRPAAEAETMDFGEPLAAAEMVERRPSAKVEEADAFVGAIAEELVRKVGIMCSVSVNDGEDGYRNVRVVTDADSANAMAGRRNSTITAVQHLVDRMAARVAGEQVRVNVDINNYRQRKDGRLTTMAKSAMARVKDSGEPEHMPPMNARERRVVHMEVAEVDGLTTITEGEDRDRHVVIQVEAE